MEFKGKGSPSSQSASKPANNKSTEYSTVGDAKMVEFPKRARNGEANRPDMGTSRNKGLQVQEAQTLGALLGKRDLQSEEEVDTKTKIKRPSFLAKQFRMMSKGAPKLSMIKTSTKESTYDASSNPNEAILRAPKDSLDADPNSSSTNYSHSRHSGSLDRVNSSRESSPARSHISHQYVPETEMSSPDHGYSRRDGRLMTSGRSTVSSRGGVSTGQESDSFDRHGELSIAGLSLAEGRSPVSQVLSQRTEISNAADSTAPSRAESTMELNYSPDDTNSGAEMYHESTSAGPCSFSSRCSSCTFSESSSRGSDTEFEESNHVRQYSRNHSRHHSRNNSRNNSRNHSRNHGRNHHDYSSSSTTNSSHEGERRWNTNFSSKKSSESRSNQIPTRGHKTLCPTSRSYRKKRDTDRHYNSRQLTTTRVFEDHRSNHKRRDLGNPVDLNSKVAVLLGKYGSRKGLRIAGLESGAPSTNLECNLDRMTNNPGDVPLDSLSPQEAVAVFQDEVARMMVEDGEYAEVQDIDEFLDGYLRLSSPFYVQMVQEFLRALCVDCYKRPLELPKVQQQQQHYSHSEY